IGRMSDEMRQDEGTVYLFDTSGRRATRALRGHRGPVLSMIFAPARRGKPSLLLSCAQEAEGERMGGRVRLWDVAAGKELASTDHWANPRDGRPGLAAWHTGPAAEDLSVALAVAGQPLRIWSVAGKTLRDQTTGPFDRAVAVLPGDPGKKEPDLLLAGAYSKGWKLFGYRVEGGEKLVPEGSTMVAWS